MRILHVSETAAAGVGRHVLELAHGQALAGLDVHVVYSTKRLDKSFAQKAVALAQIPRLTLHALDMNKQLNIRDLAVMKRLAAYSRLHGPFTIVHSHSTKAGLVGRLPKFGPGCCRIYTPHAPQSMNPAHPRPLRLAYQVLERSLAFRTDGIIAVSEEEADHLRSIGISPEKIFVVHNGISGADKADKTLRPQLRARWQIKDGEVCVGSLGRLVPQKDPELLINAFAKLSAEQRRSAVLAIAGDGPLAGNVKEKAQALGIADRIRWIDGPDANRAILSMFDIFALTSLYEGFPYVLLEALEAGLPIVTSAIGGSRAIIQQGKNGAVVSSRSADVFAGELGKLISSTSARAQLGEASRKHLEKFSVRAMVQNTLAVYASAAHQDAQALREVSIF
jgi:glycosyltransferase involved in cell wall biosynthesis